MGVVAKLADERCADKTGDVKTSRRDDDEGEIGGVTAELRWPLLLLLIHAIRTMVITIAIS